MLLPLLLLSCGQKKSDADETNDKEVVCFVYHRFGDDRYPSTNTAEEDFRAHLQYLKANDFQVLTFSDAVDYLKSSGPAKKTVVITIDDGYSSFYEKGLSLLKEFGFPATLFINTKTVGGAGYMDWSELKDCKNNRIEIGNHTHSHDYFLNIPADSRYGVFKDELKLSQEIIRKNLDEAPEVFAYPFGEYDLKMLEIVKNMGFKAAAAQMSGVIHSGTELMLCPRYPMSESYSKMEKFASKAAMHALKVAAVSPESPILPIGTHQPELSVKLSSPLLKTEQLQCFIQGSKCDFIIKEDGTIRIKALESIANRRRTLYTITVPDKNGEWHWFSHLWINPEISEVQ